MNAQATPEWHAKNVKLFNGMEGEGFNCSLYRGDIRVAEVIDDATGGPIMFHWIAKGGQDKEAFDAYCASLPLWGSEFEGETDTHPVTPDIAVNQLVSDALEDKRLRRHCHSKILFKVPGDGTLPGNWRTVKGTFTVGAVAEMKRRFGENVEILNFKYGEPA